MAIQAEAAHDADPLDVLVVGAGISGIGAAWHLKTRCPGKSFAVFEALDGIGGTWKVHTYPGIRSDSDLYTFGYRFKPWTGPPIATAGQILAYMNAVIAENGLAPYLHLRHRILQASWSSRDRLWTLRADTPGGEKRVRARVLWMCQGYYDLSRGHTPDWPGFDDFAGTVIHPQSWPADADIDGRRVVVIGSGATAATLVPAIADRCAHVTMLQRSPTYFVTGRNASDLADELRRLEIDESWIHEIIRRKVLRDQADFTRRAEAEPEAVKKELLAGVRAYLGRDFDIATHFTPRYRPWQQRIAFIPDGDLFRCVAAGKANVVTDRIERFEATGIRLASGDLLEADTIITATGFNLSFLGGIPFDLDGEPVAWNERLTYRGMMVEGVPNMLFVFGYFRASWTLRVDLLGDFMVRLLAHMDAIGAAEVRPVPPAEIAGAERLPWIDPENFSPGYMMRGQDRLPRRGLDPDWQHNQDYWAEKDEIPAIDLAGPGLVYRDAEGRVLETDAAAA